MLSLLLLGWFVTVANTRGTVNDSKKIVCYYTNWSQYRPSIGKFTPDDINPFLCTHIIFAFGSMKDNQLTAYDASDESQGEKKGLYERVTDLKEVNPSLKVLLAVGGWSFGTRKFKAMSSNSFNRRRFIFSALEYLRQRNFDGLEVDWEFPNNNIDKKNFLELLKELRETFESEATENNLPKLLLTAAVSPVVSTINSSYDVPNMIKSVAGYLKDSRLGSMDAEIFDLYLDFVNIMTYDFHGKWETKTGHHSPLYPRKNETESSMQLCVDFSAKVWEDYGAPKDKIVVGMVTYGRSFTLADKNKNGLNASTVGGGNPGEYTKEEGFLAYYEICQMLQKGATYVWDEEMKVPYAFLGDQWVGFGDERSLRLKMMWLKKNNYAGVMIWAIDLDDFKGSCGSFPFPLTSIIAEELLNKSTKSHFYNIEQVLPSASETSLSDDKTGATNKTVSQLFTFMEEEGQNNLDSNARIICAFTNWSTKRQGIAKFTPDLIDPNLCTHIIYAFGGINDFELTPFYETDITHNSEIELYDQVLALKKKNERLQVLLSVGGWITGSEPFIEMTKNLYRKSRFIFSTIEFLRLYGFDGLNVDWEFPRGLLEKTRFTELIKDLKEVFEGEARASKKPRLLLSASVPGNFEAINAGYDVEELDKYLDIFNVMTYDFHGAWEHEVGHNSPLHSLKGRSKYSSKLTVDYGAKEWVKKGASKEKLIIGIPTYGRSYTLQKESLTDIGAPAIGGGQEGNYTRESGFMAFYEVCDFIKSGATLIWDNEQMVPYAYKGNQWVGFDDIRSVKTKIQWLKQAGFGGVMIWSLDLDDFLGSCMGYSYPLLKTAKNELRGYMVANLEVLDSRLYNPLGERELACEEQDRIIYYHQDKKDCSKYYICHNQQLHHMSCPANLVFNLDVNLCDWPENVKSCLSKT